MCFPYYFNFLLADSQPQTPVDLPRLENAFFFGPLSRQVTTEIHR